MRATDIIRNVLDLIDYLSNPLPQPDVNPIEIQTGVDTNRFKQIFDILSSENEQLYSNSPNTAISGIESVTSNAGGGWNGPKNPADMKADSISMYPNHLHNPRE